MAAAKIPAKNQDSKKEKGKTKDLLFPKHFFWGTSSSSYQVEGCAKNDWSAWETSKKRIDELNKRELSAEEFINKKTCDHYERYEQDFNLCQELHTNAHRFSIEWARIMPAKGKIDEKEIRHYLDVIKALQKRKIEPFVTAYHFTLPQWIAEQGGWLSKDTITYFEDYISLISEKFRHVKFWLTMNEPTVLTYKGYLKASWPPQIMSISKTKEVIFNLAEAHKRAYAILNKVPGREIGIAHSMIDFRGFLGMYDYPYNLFFLEQIKQHLDFIGLNYYSRKRMPPGFRIQRSDMGWAIYPQGIYHVLKELKRYGKPIYITENGIADYTDTKRPKYILEHLKYVHRAIREGIDVRGYFYWSLLDNFEWDSGFTKKFGLIEVEKTTLKRIPRKSFSLYKDICTKNGITDEIRQKYLG